MADRHDLRRLCESQHGLCTTDQIAELGFGRDRRAHLIEHGTLERVYPRVLRLAGAPPSKLQHLLAIVLAAGGGGALSHLSALAHWGVRGFAVEPVHVVRHRDAGDATVAGAVIHEVRDLPTEEVRVLDGVPVVSPALALLQLAGMRRAHPDRVGRALDAAWSDRLVSYRVLDSLIARLSQRGRPGLVLLRELVQERGPSYVPPASGLESRVAQILARAGLPELRRQVDSGDGDGWIGRVDFRDAELPLVLEVQSERFHASLTASRADEVRLGRLVAAGYEVLEVTDTEVFHRPDDVVERVRAARQRLMHRRRAA